MAGSNNPKILRYANRYLVLTAILENGTLTTEDMVRITGLSRPTVLEILKTLLSEGLIAKAGIAPSEVGRQPTLYAINTHSRFAMGIDIDFPSIHLAVSDLAGAAVFCATFDLDFNASADEVAKKLVEYIESALIETGIDRSQIIGLGLGVPALMNVTQNQAVRISKIPSWHELDIASYIFDRTGIAVSVHNDAHLLGLIEKKRHNIQDESFIYVMHRTGVGSAIFINGKLYDGAFGNSGYIGHMSINMDGELCECGNRGCLELYCSRRAILNNYNLLMEKSGAERCVSLSKIYALADDGDDTAIKVLTRAGEYLGIGIVNFMKAYDIYHIIVGETRCGKSNPFFQSIVSSVNRNLIGFQVAPVQIDLGLVDSESSGLSGCHYVLSKFFSEPKLRVRA